MSNKEGQLPLEVVPTEPIRDKRVDCKHFGWIKPEANGFFELSFVLLKLPEGTTSITGGKKVLVGSFVSDKIAKVTEKYINKLGSAIANRTLMESAIIFLNNEQRSLHAVKNPLSNIKIFYTDAGTDARVVFARLSDFVDPKTHDRIPRIVKLGVLPTNQEKILFQSFCGENARSAGERAKK